MYHTQIFMDSLGHGPSNLVLDAPSIGLDAPPLWPRRSSFSPRRSWFGFGCSCLGSCLSCEVVLGPLPSCGTQLTWSTITSSQRCSRIGQYTYCSRPWLIKARERFTSCTIQHTCKYISFQLIFYWVTLLKKP